MKIRYLTEITGENIFHCKQLVRFLSGFRHLEGIKGNFYISNTEYIAPATFHEKGKPASQMIYSNIKELIEHQQFVFDTLWNKAIPAEQKLMEIEEGVKPPRTRIMEKQQEIIKEIRNLNNAANKLSVCTSFGGMQMSYNYLFDTYKHIIEKYREGKSKEGLRWLMNIEKKESVSLVRIFSESGIQIRHVKNMPPLNFGVSDKEVAMTVEKMIGGTESNSFLISNEPLYVNHFNSLFDELWSSGMDAKERIKEIEQRIDPEFIEVITDREKASCIILDLAKSVKNEALSLMPTARGMLRMDKLGVIDHLIRASHRGAAVKIICPLTEENSNIIRKIAEQAPDIKIMNGCGEAASGILIADNEKFFQAEVKDPMADRFSKAIGFAIYSNSKRNVNSFKSFFELLWNERTLNEELEKADRMQKEFINIAAHELRNPVQPILGLSVLLESKEGNIAQYKDMLNVISRNAKRLKLLTQDILDAAKIESQRLDLSKRQVNLNDVVQNSINDFKILLKSEGKDDRIRVEFISSEKENTLFVYVDVRRITQVIFNLLNNALKFTEEGRITVMIKKGSENHKDNNSYCESVVVSIEDTGKGIDDTVKDKLFEKFETKSEKGIGLGLYISRKIIEAHRGRIWAENNKDGKGATFSFSLTLS